MQPRAGYASAAPAHMPTRAECDTAAEPFTMAEVVAQIDRDLASATNDLGMVHADLSQGSPGCAGDSLRPADLTLFDRLQRVRETAAQVSFQAAQIRLRLGKVE